MKRFIYVPSVLDIERGERIAASVRLPIQIGESENTKNLEFNRKEVSIINVPSVMEFHCHDQVHSQISFYCDIINEWKNFLKIKVNLKITGNNKEFFVDPQLKEVHSVRFSPRISNPGNYKLFVMFDDEIEIEKDIIVL